VITGRPVTVAAAFANELPHLMPPPVEPFDPARLLDARVDNRVRVSVRQCYYSVPARFAGRAAARHLPHWGTGTVETSLRSALSGLLITFGGVGRRVRVTHRLHL